MKFVVLLSITVVLAGCTTGHLRYIDDQGNLQTACETEYRWAPTVDKHAVDYILHYCAQKALEKGYQVLNSDILALTPTLPPHPTAQAWTFDEATRLYKSGQLSAQEYGYVIADIDLHLQARAYQKEDN